MESSSTGSYIFDPESPTEMARLINQDRVTTNSMGGPLSGITTPSLLHNILDLGSGPGGWALDVAFIGRYNALLLTSGARSSFTFYMEIEL
jgi:hypothetical protein